MPSYCALRNSTKGTFFRFMFGAVQLFNVLILTLQCVLLFNLVKLTELPPVCERAANSANHLLKYVCFAETKQT